MLIGAWTAFRGGVGLLDRGYSVFHPFNGAFLRVEDHKNWGEVVATCVASSNTWAQTSCQ